ncbi:MAG: ABC transporter ATP-binding protein [Armatimonadota bacterium]
MRMIGPGRASRMGETTPLRHPWQSFKRVLPWITPYWFVLLFGFVCMFVSMYLGQQPPRIIAYAVDYVLKGQRYGLIQQVVLLSLGVYFATHLFGFLRTYWLHVAGQRMLHNLRTRLYGHYQQLSLTYYDNRQTGDLMSRMTGDVEQIEHIMVHGLDVLIMGLFSMALAFYYMYQYHPQLALLVLIPVPVLAISIFFFSRVVRTIYRAIRDRVGDLNAKLQDNISGIRVIKAFCREETELEHVTDDSVNVLSMNVKGIRMWSSFGPAMGFLSNIGYVIVLGVGATLVARGQLEVGELIACTMFAGNFYSPVSQLFQFFDSIQRSLAAGERILEVLETAPDIRDPELPKELSQIHGEVEFRDVSFCYATGEEVLHNVNVLAKPGERIALVGRSGAGKTSFINLIPRFYDALEGSILVDGVDVRELRQTDLRRHIALVLQETFLFNGTVRENLLYGKPGATDDELIAAAQVANAHEFIERLQKGYDTEIGERGVKLSGGQKQRLAIARAVLANPRILILDEATSLVDSESEFLIHQALERLMEGRTTFIIAHRLSTIKHADTILVLEDGSIVERGSHQQLTHAGGLYAQMYRQQFWLDELLDDEEKESAPLPQTDMPVLE